MRKRFFLNVALLGFVLGVHHGHLYGQTTLDKGVSKGNLGASRNLGSSGLAGKVPSSASQVQRPKMQGSSSTPMRSQPSISPKNSVSMQQAVRPNVVKPTVATAKPKNPSPIAQPSRPSAAATRVVKPQSSLPNAVRKPSTQSSSAAKPSHSLQPSTVNKLPSNKQPSINDQARGMVRTATSGSQSTVGKKPNPTRSQSNGQIGSAAQDRLGALDQDALHHGREVANGLRELDAIRQSLPDGVREFGIPGNASQGSSVPGLQFGEEGEATGFQGRDIQNPLDRFGSGMTDIRGSRDRSRQGNRSSLPRLSSFGNQLATSGPNTSPVEVERNGNDVYGFASTEGGGNHITIDHYNERGNLVGHSDRWVSSTPDAGVRTVDVYDERGQFVSSETIVNYNDGSTVSKAVAADGSVVVTSSDANGEVTQYTVECDRSNGDIAMGGPIGPTVGQWIGMDMIDLVRQFVEGESTSGGENRMTSGTLGSQHVRPDANPNSGSQRNRVRVDSFGTISNPGPATGGGTGGGDRPN